MMARVLYLHLSRHFKLQISAKSWYDHQPLPVVENDVAKILWDFGLYTSAHLLSNRPDIALFLKEENT